jgi:hypothetical protein
MTIVARPELALAGAGTLGGVAVLALSPDHAWWGRLLAEPKLQVFATLPCLQAWGPTVALAVAAVTVEPTGADQTLWVTDAPHDSGRIINDLSRDGVAARLVVRTGGLSLFALAGFYQRDDARLARAPGRLSGVIGAAPEPLPNCALDAAGAPPAPPAPHHASGRCCASPASGWGSPPAGSPPPPCRRCTPQC